jgi:hypothetical protein
MWTIFGSLLWQTLQAALTAVGNAAAAIAAVSRTVLNMASSYHVLSSTCMI